MTTKKRSSKPKKAPAPAEPDPIDDTVPPLSDSDPLSEEEERDVLISMQEIADGKGIAMRPDETVEEFLNRGCDGDQCTIPLTAVGMPAVTQEMLDGAFPPPPKPERTTLADLCDLAVAIESLCIAHGYEFRIEISTNGAGGDSELTATASKREGVRT